MANIQRYKLLMLGSTVQAFREHYEDSDPVATALDQYLTYIELLGVWSEHNQPFTHAKRLAETKMLGKEQRYLLQTIEQVDNASTDALLDVAEKYMDEHTRLIAVLNKQVHQLEECDKNRLERIEELLAVVDEKQETIDDLISEKQARDAELHISENMVSDLQNRLNELQGDYADLEATEKQLRSSLDSAEHALATKEETIDRLIAERNDVQDNYKELQARYDTLQADYNNMVDDI